MASFIATVVPYLITAILYLVYAVAALLACILILYVFIRPKHVDPSVPGPKRVRFLGVTFGAESQVYQDFSWSKWPSLSIILSQQYGFQTWGGPTLNIGFGGAFFNIVSPDCLQHILRDNFDNYHKGKVARKCLRELLGTGIFTADGEVWKFHRKIVTSIMTRDMVVHQGVPRVCQTLQEVDLCLRKTAAANQTIDFQDLCFRMTLDVFVRMAFGVELDCVKNQSELVPFMQAFNELQYLSHQRFNDLFWEMKQFFCIGERERQILDCAKVIDDFCQNVIDSSRKQAQVDPDHKGTDLISTFFRQAKARNEPPPTDKEVRDVVMNFILAGRDSTACGLSWTLYELTKHPLAVDRIRDEVRRVVGSKATNYTFETVEMLEYTHAVVMEALRLHPPVPDDFKFSIKADILPDGTRIPQGSCVMYSINTINHSNKVWGDNANDFVPERFLGKVEPSPFRYPVFHAGPRMCPGKPLALMEIKMALAYLLPRFDFLDEAGHDGDYTWTLVMSMANGFPVQVRVRN